MRLEQIRSRLDLHRTNIELSEVVHVVARWGSFERSPPVRWESLRSLLMAAICLFCRDYQDQVTFRPCREQMQYGPLRGFHLDIEAGENLTSRGSGMASGDDKSSLSWDTKASSSPMRLLNKIKSTL
jgi:hypothetical protein